MHRPLLILIGVALAGCTENGSAQPSPPADPVAKKPVVAKLAEKPNLIEQFTKQSIGRAAVKKLEQRYKEAGLKAASLDFVSNIFVDELKSHDDHRRWIVITEVSYWLGDIDSPFKRDHFFIVVRRENGDWVVEHGRRVGSDN